MLREWVCFDSRLPRYSKLRDNMAMASESENSNSSSNPSPPGFHEYVPQVIQKSTGPYLEITEQPAHHFRFRYRSESAGSHGCVLGKSSGRVKTYPSVQLKNYGGSALIRCSLANWDNPSDHAHELAHDENEDDISSEVGPEKGYEVRFPGLGIVHTPKKDLAKVLMKKCIWRNPNHIPKGEELAELKQKVVKSAKEMELNKVRLKFSAYSLDANGTEICKPVFSSVINNKKSALTNDLKICRMSRCVGSPRGDDEIFLFVEKVIKNQIGVRLIETNDSNQIIWSKDCLFNENDVHRQYGIVVRTPPYREMVIEKDHQVYIQLYRKFGCAESLTSDPVPFTFTPDIETFSKEAISYASIGSNDKSLKFGHLATSDIMDFVSMSYQPTAINGMKSDITLEDALMSKVLGRDEVMLSDASSLPQVECTSAEFQHIVASKLDDDDFQQFRATIDLEKYLEESMEFDIDPNDLQSDGASKKQSKKPACTKPATCSTKNGLSTPKTADVAEASLNKMSLHIKEEDLHSNTSDTSTLSEFSQEEEQKEQNIVDVLFTKGLKSMETDSDGDTAFHLAAMSQHRLQPLLNAIREEGIQIDINTKNKAGQTALHIAAAYKGDCSNNIKLLLSNGAESSILDKEGRNAIHIAASNGNVNVMEMLLECLPDVDVDYVDACGLTALQIACGKPDQSNTIAIMELLLEKGADVMKCQNNTSAWDLAKNYPTLKKILQEYVSMVSMFNKQTIGT